MVKSAALSLFFLLFFYGCAEWDLGLDAKNDGSPPPPPVQETAYPFSDIPIPAGFSRDDAKSFIYESGSGTVKVGRFIFIGSENPDQINTFYQNEMVNKGWSLINSIKHNENYIQNYEKESFVATVTINSSGGLVGKTIIEIQAGPK